MSIDKNSDSIQVMVRVRPPNSRELSEDFKSCVFIDESHPNTIILDTKPESKMFTFDWVAGEETSQENIFNAVGRPMIEACLEGYNCCIFAYGQTGAGKTYTMQGAGLSNKDQNSKDFGLQPRVIDCVFSIIAEEMAKLPEVQYSVTGSYFEIYNEQIRDLLRPASTNLQIREDVHKGVHVEGVKEQVVSTSEETIGLLQEGITNKHVEPTRMNPESSRSHCVFTIRVENKRLVNGLMHVKVSKFHFVDLAGSERQKQTLSSGERLKEAGNINKSLLVLGQVINSLVKGKGKPIRYRESKLTFFLKDSIGGNSKTCLIANISPAQSALSETLSTLKFASTTKEIKNRASVNHDASGNIESLKKEIKRLQEELNNIHNKLSVSPSANFSLLSNRMGEEANNISELHQDSVIYESLLKQELEAVFQSQLLLQAELTKNEKYLTTAKTALEIYEANELQYRSIISLYESKLQRKNSSTNKSAQKDKTSDSFMLEQDNTEQEKHCLLEIVKNTPVVMRVFMENIQMKEKLESLEVDPNIKLSVSSGKYLEESLALLKEVIAKIDENNKHRKILNDSILEIEGGDKGETSLQVTTKKAKYDLERIEMEYDGQEDRSSFEILELKQKEEENLRSIEKEREMIAELTKKIGILDAVSSELREKLSQLNEQNSQLRGESDQNKKKIEEDFIKACEEREKSIKIYLLEEKERLQAHFTEQLHQMILENETMINAMISLENERENLARELVVSKDEKNQLQRKIEELVLSENKYKLSIEKLQVAIEEMQNNHRGEILRRETIILEETNKAKSFENEKDGLKQELKKLHTSLDEMENKYQHLDKLNEKLKSRNEKLESKVQEKEELLKSLEKQIMDQISEEDSTLNRALKEISTLKLNLSLKNDDLEKTRLILDEKEQVIQKGRERDIELDQKNNYLSQTLQKVSVELEDEKARSRALQAELDSRIKQIQELEKESEQNKELMSGQKKEMEGLDTKLKEAQNDIEYLKNILEKVQKEKSELVSCLEATIKENSEIKQKISLETNNKAFEEKVTELENNYKNQINTLKKNIQDFEEVCHGKTTRIDALKATLADLETKNQEIKNQKSELSHQIEELKGVLELKDKELDSCRAKMNDYLRRLLDLEEKCLKDEHGPLNIRETEPISDKSDLIVFEDMDKVVSEYLKKEQESTAHFEPAEACLDKVKSLYCINGTDDIQTDEKKEELRIDDKENQNVNLDLNILIEEKSIIKSKIRKQEMLARGLKIETINRSELLIEELFKVRKAYGELAKKSNSLLQIIRNKEKEAEDYKEDANLIAKENAKMLEEANKRQTELQIANIKNNVLIKKLLAEKIRLLDDLENLKIGEQTPFSFSKKAIPNKDKGDSSWESDFLFENDKLKKEIEELAKIKKVDSFESQLSQINEASVLYNAMIKYKKEKKDIDETIQNTSYLNLNSKGLEEGSWELPIFCDSNFSSNTRSDETYNKDAEIRVKRELQMPGSFNGQLIKEHRGIKRKNPSLLMENLSMEANRSFEKSMNKSALRELKQIGNQSMSVSKRMTNTSDMLGSFEKIDKPISKKTGNRSISKTSVDKIYQYYDKSSNPITILDLLSSDSANNSFEDQGLRKKIKLDKW